MKTALPVVLLILTCSLAPAADSHYWQLGHGTYAPYLRQALQTVPELDFARWDWLVVEIDSPETVQAMNRLLEINPKLRFLARLWPINGMGDPEHRAAQGTCLDYMLYPQKKAEIDRRTREAIRQLKSGISNWDSIVCLTFLEEMPGAWGCGELLRYNGEGPLPRPLVYHKEGIEKALGKPLAWDAQTKAWLGQQYIESLASVHRIIKEESGGKLVFYWHHTNFATLDDLPEPLPADFDLLKWPGYPVRFSDLIKPGLCDGLMAYPNNAQIWENKYQRHIRKHNWLFYSQLSHPSFMRLCSWPESVAMVTGKQPQNLGYFLYCEGSCAARNVWNDDQSIPDAPEWNQRRISQALHLRHVAKQLNVGMDVVRRALHLRVTLDHKLGDLKPGSITHLVAHIQNPKDETYFTDPSEAVARNVKVMLSLPAGVVADPTMTAATVLDLGDLPAGGSRLVDWWLTVQDPKALENGPGVKVTATSSNTHPGVMSATGDVSFPALETQRLSASGASWLENGFRFGGLRPVIEISALGQPIKNLRLSDGTHTIAFSGEIWAGMKLVITPDMKARLLPDNLLPPMDQLRDANDPTGYKSYDAGYGVASFSVGRYLRPGAKYVMTISGQAAEGGNSLAVLRSVKSNREVWQPSVLANRFGPKWASASETITIPSDVESLERIYLYRFQSKGRVWYGPATLVPADLPAEGFDASDRLSGQPLQIEPSMLPRFAYSDDSPDTILPKVQIRLLKPEDAMLKALGPGQL